MTALGTAVTALTLGAAFVAGVLAGLIVTSVVLAAAGIVAAVLALILDDSP